MTIGQRIKNLRKNISMSQEELGQRLGVGKSTVSEWENGKRGIPIDTIDQIAEALDATVPALMGWNVDSIRVDRGNVLSPAALSVAQKYDLLTEHGQKVVSAVIDLELEHSAQDAELSERLEAAISSRLPDAASGK